MITDLTMIVDNAEISLVLDDDVILKKNNVALVAIAKSQLIFIAVYVEQYQLTSIGRVFS